MTLTTITEQEVQEALEDISTSRSRARAFIGGQQIEENGDISLEDAESSDLINLDNFRADPRFAGINGAGYSTVIIDSGIDLNHPFFGPDSDANGIADRIVYQYDFADNDASAEDVSGHGSNVASIAASSDSRYRGIAPGSNIIALKVFTDLGGGGFRDIEEALQWVVANAATYNIASINMSLSDAQNHSSPQRLYGISDELQALKDLGIITVSASGNRFITFSSQQGVGYPAADPNSISVGAVFDSSFGRISYSSGATANTTGADRITPFSQRHSALSTIFAPGAPITGAGRNGTTATYHGTSQATPHIAGIATLMQQLAVSTLGRRLTVDEFTQLLRTTGVTISDGDDEDDNVINTGLNFKRVDVQALGQAILEMGNGSINVNHILSTTAARVTEGASGFTPVTFTISRTGAISSVTSVQYSLGGTAINATDYTVASVTGDNVTITDNTILFGSGSRTATITVNVLGDAIPEPDKSITVSLSNPIIAAQSGIPFIYNSPTTTTIVDDDPTLSINNVRITEGNTGTTNARFTVTLSKASASNVTVDFATADQTAITPSDYNTTGGTLTFRPGETSKTVNVSVVGDTEWEGNETFLVNLSNPTNALLANSQGIGTINNNDALPPTDYAIAANLPTIAEGDTLTPVTFTINRTGFTSTTGSVKYTLGGTASNNTDYRLVGVTGTGVTVSGTTVNFATGATQATITLNVVEDVIKELDEAINVTISTPTPTGATISNSLATTTIADNDPTPAISVQNVTVTEANPGTVTRANFRVTLSNPSSQPVTVNYSTADNSAIASSDYTTSTGTLTFDPRQTSQTISVDLINDTVREATETFFFNLSNPTNATINTPSAVGTIRDNDPLPAISINDLTVIEGNTGTNTTAQFTISLSNPSSQVITVNSITTDGTATVAGGDYITASNPITFNLGETSKTIDIQVNGDNNPETDENFSVILSGATNASIADNNGIATIINNDFVGTDNPETLTGTANNDTIAGLLGADTLTGGAGSDQFIYNSANDGIDTITDFTVGSDTIVLSNLLRSIGYNGTNAIADQYIRFVSQVSATTIELDRDGVNSTNTFQPFIVVQGVTTTAINNPANFLF